MAWHNLFYTFERSLWLLLGKKTIRGKNEGRETNKEVAMIQTRARGDRDGETETDSVYILEGEPKGW